MSTIRETVFDLLFNAFLLIGVFSIIAAVFSRLVARARAKYQYRFYVAVFVFCLAMPVVNTFWHSHLATTPQKAQEQVSSQAGGAGHFIWPWRSSMERKQFTISPEIQNWLVGIWALFVLYRLVHFSRSVYRVRRLRKGASVHPLAAGTVEQIIGPGHRVLLLESAAIDDPVTVGVFHPAILLPSKVVPRLCEQDLLAILAHEYGHIRRGDFLVNILCELLALPMVWHPGIRYLKSKISQTRELACDDYAAARLGKRRLYANSLLRLASLCLHTPRGKAIALGIFDGDNLEERIMMLTEKRRSLTRAGVVGLTLAMSIPFGAGAVLAQATSLEAGPATSNTAEAFAGTWHWMFNGKSFSTMVLVRDGASFKGSVTPSRIKLNDDGELSRADRSENSAPAPIAEAELKGSALHVKVIDGGRPFEFTVTLKDETHAEIRPVGAPTNMKPILAEKAH